MLLHLMKTVTIFISSVLARRVVDGLMLVSPFSQAVIDAVLVGVDEAAIGNETLDDRLDGLLTLASILITTSPLRCIIPRIGGFSFFRVPDCL